MYEVPVQCCRCLFFSQFFFRLLLVAKWWRKIQLYFLFKENSIWSNFFCPLVLHWNFPLFFFLCLFPLGDFCLIEMCVSFSCFFSPNVNFRCYFSACAVVSYILLIKILVCVVALGSSACCQLLCCSLFSVICLKVSRVGGRMYFSSPSFYLRQMLLCGMLLLLKISWALVNLTRSCDIPIHNTAEEFLIFWSHVMAYQLRQFLPLYSQSALHCPTLLSPSTLQFVAATVKMTGLFQVCHGALTSTPLCFLSRKWHTCLAKPAWFHLRALAFGKWLTKMVSSRHKTRH